MTRSASPSHPEVESVIEANEDSEVLVEVARQPLSQEDWQTIERWLAASRAALLRALAEASEEHLDDPIEGRERTVREQVIHIALVELMYAEWTFDLDSREGLTEFLTWTRAPPGGGCEHWRHTKTPP
jgi:hypothetical protein